MTRIRPHIGIVLSIVGAAVFLCFELLLVRGPAVYENSYFFDLLYLANSGWAAARGAVPNIDFADPYGGIIARSLALFLTGPAPSIKAIDQAMALLYGMTIVLLLAAGWRRLSPFALFAAFLIVTALLTTRNPLEHPTVGIATSSHAMLYNRLGWSWLFVAIIAALPSSLPSAAWRRWLDIAIAGIATLLMIAVKPTFAVGGIAVAMAFLERGRIRDFLGWILAMIVAFAMFWLLADMGPHQWLAVAQRLSSGGGEALGGALGPVAKGFFVIGRNFFPLAALIVAMTLSYVTRWRSEHRMLLFLTTTMAIGFVITLTTGSFAAQQVQTPICAMLAVLVVDKAVQQGKASTALWITAAYTILVFCLPHLMNTLASGAREGRIASLRVIDTGPLAQLAVGVAGDTPLPLGPERSASEIRTAGKLNAVRSLAELNDQELALIIADGVRMLQRLPDHRLLGIASPYPSIFPFALQARPVLSLDLWREPAHAPVRPLAPDVDVLMILPDDDSLSAQRDTLLKRARPDFVPCTRSRFWQAYIRRQLANRCGATEQKTDAPVFPAHTHRL